MIASVRNVRLNLSKYLDLVRHGEEVVVKNRNTPIAKIIPFEPENFTRHFPDFEKLRAKQMKQGKATEKLVRLDRDGRD